MVVHLVLAALGAVAVEAQSLVGHELPGARVNSGTNGNTAGATSVQRKSNARSRVATNGECENSCRYCAGSDGLANLDRKHTQGRDLIVEKPLVCIHIPCRGDVRGRTERDQLRRDLLDLAQTLRDGVGCKYIQSAGPSFTPWIQP